MTYLHRLQEREHILNNKKQELDDILRTHNYLQEQVNMNKAAEKNIQHDLAS